MKIVAFKTQIKQYNTTKLDKILNMIYNISNKKKEMRTK